MSSRTVPGSSGLPLVGETLPFLRDVKQFIDHRVDRHGPVFRTNILGSTTAFSCAYSSTLDVLFPKVEKPSDTPSLDAAEAYNEFMAPLYPLPNLLLLQDAHPRRKNATLLLNRLLTENLPRYIPIIRGIVQSQIQCFASSGPSSLRPYAFFKSLTERVVTTVILGNLEPNEYLTIRKLCSQHFNGIVAAPVHVEAFGARSARASAVHAHQQLTNILEPRLRRSLDYPSGDRSVLTALANELRQREIGDEEMCESAQLLLVLLSTAVPKALASALSSAVSFLSRERDTGLQQRVIQEAENGETELLDGLLMETVRMLPPLPGGMRQSNGACVGGRGVPKRWRVWYSALHSNRDKEVYADAEQFLPDRWSGLGKTGVGCPFEKPGGGGAVPTPLSFGAGERHCKGRDMAWAIMRECLVGLLQEFAVEMQTDSESELRFIPVLRSSSDKAVPVRRRKL